MGILTKLGLKKDIIIKEGYPLTSPYIRQLFSLDRSEKLTSPYAQHTVVYAAIRSKATNIAQVPFLIYDQSGKVIDNPSNPVVRLFEDVNPYIDGYELWEAIVTMLDIYGEAFIVKDTQEWKGLPVYLWPVRGDTMKEMVVDSRLVAWEYTASGKKMIIYPDQVIQIKYYNPFNTYRGLSPLTILKLVLDGDWEALQYNRRFFKNDGTPGAVYTTDQVLTEGQYERLKAQLIDARKGSANAFRAMLLDGGVKLGQGTPGLKDMQFLELRKFSKEEIAMVFGVPKQELQTYEDINFATSRTADLGYWKKTLLPIMSRIEMKFNRTLFNQAGGRGYFDIRAIDVLNEEFLQKIESAVKLHGIGVPFAEINRRLDLGFPDDMEIEERYGSSIPFVSESAEPGIKKAVKGSVDVEEVLKAQRAKKWHEKMDVLYPLFGRVSRIMKNYFHDVEQKLLRKATEKAIAVCITKAEDEDSYRWVDEAFDDSTIERIMSDPMEKALKMGIRDRTPPSEMEKAILAKRMRKIKGINETGREEVKSKLKQALLDAMQEGVPESERAQIVRDAIKDSMEVNKNRARTIARTEVHGAYSESQWETGKYAGMKKIMWVSSRDDRVRDSHMALDGKTVKCGDRFENGLLYPMDDSGAPEEVINCRCVFAEIYED